jgi:hypothetical protein
MGIAVREVNDRGVRLGWRRESWRRRARGLFGCDWCARELPATRLAMALVRMGLRPGAEPLLQRHDMEA